MERVEVAVVGAGLLGSATALALGERGARTLLLEQFDPGHARGSSHGATRIFRFSYPDPDYVAMAVSAAQAWRRLQSEAGEELLVTTGGLDAGLGAAACAAALGAQGVAHSWLSGDEVTRRFPGLAAAPDERMLYQADAGVCLADRAVAALRRLAVGHGAELRPRTPVLAIEPRGDHAVLATGFGDLAAEVAVITAGPWAGGLLTEAISAVPRLTPTLQQVRYFKPRAGLDSWPVLIEWMPAGLSWYAVPQAGAAPGVKVAAHLPGPQVDPRDGPFETIDPGPEALAEQYVRQRLPGLDPAGQAAETCLYTLTADEGFVLDREGPVVVGGGCSGHGFKFGPLLGEVLADLALGNEPAIPRAKFSLSRPALRAASHPA